MREIEFELEVPFDEFLERAGRLPLPPYVETDSDAAQRGYQTVFARVPGSVAAPTASLHFTPELLSDLEGRGVEVVRLTLDVGLGTFRPMQGDRIDGHAMHAETYEISPETVRRISDAKRQGRRVVAAGTTVVRALEGNVRDTRRVVRRRSTPTKIFIHARLSVRRRRRDHHELSFPAARRSWFSSARLPDASGCWRHTRKRFGFATVSFPSATRCSWFLKGREASQASQH